eukprot:7469483-Karenia_brevis.AAC.1
MKKGSQKLRLEWISVWGAKVTIFHMFSGSRSGGGKVRAQNMSLEWISVWGAKVSIFDMF